jgi:hypothetical protein
MIVSMHQVRGLIRLGTVSQAHGCDNAGISAAATDVAAHPFANFNIGELRVLGVPQIRGDKTGRSAPGFIEQCHCGDDLPGCAVAALESIIIEKRLLHRMQTTLVSNAFDGGDALSVASNCECETAIDAAAIQQHSASAALAMVAALLSPRQAKVFAKQVKQRGTRIELQLLRVSIYLDMDRVQFGRGCVYFGLCKRRSNRTREGCGTQNGAASCDEVAARKRPPTLRREIVINRFRVSALFGCVLVASHI